MFVQTDTKGRIVGIAVCGQEFAHLYSDSVEIADDHPIDAARDYILDGEPTERPTSPVTRTDLTLHDVPEGSTLFINGESYPAEGEVELEFPLPGTYRLRVECWPYRDWEGEVTA